MIRDMCSGCGMDHIGDIFVGHVLIESSLGCGHMAATAYYNGIAREVIHALNVNYSLRVDVRGNRFAFPSDCAACVRIFLVSYAWIGRCICRPTTCPHVDDIHNVHGKCDKNIRQTGQVQVSVRTL